MSIDTQTVKGKYKIEKYEAEFVDGEWVPIKLVDTIEGTNRFTASIYSLLITDQSDSRNNTQWVACVSDGIFKGALAAVADDTQQWTKGSVAVTGAYTAPAGAADAYWEFQSTINPPAADRNIRTIIMSTTATNSDSKSYTIADLASPCPQTTTEILQITYRLINDQSVISAQDSVASVVSEFNFQNRVVGSSQNLAYSYGTGYLLTYDGEVWGTGLPGSHYVGTFTSSTNNVEYYYSQLRVEFDYEEPAQGFAAIDTVLRLGRNNSPTAPGNLTGYPLKGIAVGNQGYYSNMATVSKGTDSSVQNTFGRAVDTGAIDRTPFLNNNIIATSAADVNVIDKGDWLEHRSDSYMIPYHYRITIETGGNVGTATYKLQRRRWTRWADNDGRWIPHGIPMFHFNLINDLVDEEYIDPTTAPTRKHGQTVGHARAASDLQNYVQFNYAATGDGGTLPLRYVYPEIISFDYDGLTLLSLDTNKWTNLDANSAQAQAFTEIMQVSSDGLDIYVADASQGLYKIERDAGDMNTSNWTITKLNPPGITNTNSCRGVFHKGGTYWGGPGKVVDIKIDRAGSNYAVGDTISIAGVNGTSATANVATVDANGGITSIAITNQGSGYIEDHIQAYASSGSGVGASLYPVIGAGGDMWAIFNDATDSAVYMTHMTHVGSNDYTSLNLDTTGDTITRTGGTDFLVDGFRPGQALIIRSAEEAANEGRYTISTVTSTVITVTENITTTNATDTQAQIFAEKWEVMGETITTTESLTFADANPDTITGSGTSFITQGFREGMEIVISGSVSNNGVYTIAGVTATVITLDSQDALTAEGPVSCTMATLTDFTITNYTANSTEGAGIIGLVMDQDHADDRFAILTPTTKHENMGATNQTLNTDGGWDWWSFANSTGTTAAGTTDRVRVAANASSDAAPVEQLATVCIGPFGDGTNWAASGVDLRNSLYVAWGGTTLTTQGTAQGAMESRYFPHRCKTNFEVGVIARGNDDQNWLKSNRTTTDFSDDDLEDSVLMYTPFSAIANTYSQGRYAGSNGGLHAYIGHGLGISRRLNDVPKGGFITALGNGTGVKSTEGDLPYGFWQDFGWDGTRWVLDNASARTTHAQSSFSGTSLNINATTGAIVGTGFASTDWAGDGFEAGDIITIATAEDADNNGSYVIETLSGTTLTVTPDKLPATTNTDDTTATVVGDRAIIDGLALSFDDAGATNPLVLNEYYDVYVYNGIIKDNATNGTVTTYHPQMATDTGTAFESATIPSSDVGTVTAELFASANKSSFLGDVSGIMYYYSEPGVVSSPSTSPTSSIMLGEHQIPASSDFSLRFKAAGNDDSRRMDVGVVPYADVSGAGNPSLSTLDYNARIIHDYPNNPSLDQYTIEIRNTGNGTVQHTENTNRVVLIAGQDETSYDGSPGTEGTFIGGFESATDTHAASDVLTMDDGSTITVDAVDGNGTVTQFTVTTKSTRTSGNTQIGAVSSSATSIDFNTTGNVITRTAGGTDFVTDGFKIGMKIQVDGATTEANDGAYTIQSVTTTTIVTEENLNTTESGTSAAIDHCIVQTASTGTGVNFALIPGADNLAAGDVGGDEIGLHRVGTTGDNLYWTVNGVEFYTHTSGPFNAQYGVGACAAGAIGGGIYDATLDYTIDRRYLKVGNGSTTGADDVNFRCLPSILAGTDAFRLYYDSGSGPVEFTYVTDGRTAPASGEVTILPFSGRLWFNTAQAGDTLTGNWTITKKINLD